MLINPCGVENEDKSKNYSESEAVDISSMVKKSNIKGITDIASDIASHNLNLNLTFSETSLLHNLNEQISQRHNIAEFCFE